MQLSQHLCCNTTKLDRRNGLWRDLLGPLIQTLESRNMLVRGGQIYEFGVGMGLLTAVATGLTSWQGQNTTKVSEKHLTSREGLDNLFRETHMLNLAEGDEFLEALWDRRVRTEVLKAVKTLGPAGIPSLSSSELGEIDEIIVEEVPGLRKMSNPLEAWAL